MHLACVVLQSATLTLTVFTVLSHSPRDTFPLAQQSKSALHLACGRGDCTTAARLLRKGADPTMQDKAGRTPVDEALDNECVPTAGIPCLPCLPQPAPACSA